MWVVWAMWCGEGGCGCVDVGVGERALFAKPLFARSIFALTLCHCDTFLKIKITLRAFEFKHQAATLAFPPLILFIMSAKHLELGAVVLAGSG